MVLFMARDIVEGYAVILFIIVLGAVTGGVTEAIPSYTSIVLSNMVILIVPKTLCNIIVTIK